MELPPRTLPKQEFIADLLTDSPHGKIIAHQVTGRGNLWSIMELTSATENFPAGHRFLNLDLLARSDGAWGNKSLSESMGPSECDCPLSYLDMVPMPESKYAAGFRARVRAWHTTDTSGKDLVKDMKIHDRFMLDAKEYSFLRVDRRSIHASCKSNGITYRVGPSHFSRITLVPPPAVPATAPATPAVPAFATNQRTLLASAFA